jgi:hypothetical protein
LCGLPSKAIATRLPPHELESIDMRNRQAVAIAKLVGASKVITAKA